VWNIGKVTEVFENQMLEIILGPKKEVMGS
jgi:hypothetical protein